MLKPWAELEAEMTAAGLGPGDPRYQAVEAAYRAALEEEGMIDPAMSREDQALARVKRAAYATGVLQEPPEGAPGNYEVPSALTRPMPEAEAPGIMGARPLEAAGAGFRESNLAKLLGLEPAEEPFEPAEGAAGTIERVLRGAGGVAGSPVALGLTAAVPGPIGLGLGFAGERALRAALEHEDPSAQLALEIAGEGALGALTGGAGRVGAGLARFAPASVRGAAAPALRIGAEAGTLGLGGEALRAGLEGEAFDPEQAGEAGEEALGVMLLLNAITRGARARRQPAEAVTETGVLRPGEGEGAPPPAPSPEPTGGPPPEPSVVPRWVRELERPGTGGGGTPPGPTPTEARPPRAPAPSGPVLDEAGVARVFGIGPVRAIEQRWVEPAGEGRFLITEDGLTALGGEEIVALRQEGGGGPVALPGEGPARVPLAVPAPSPGPSRGPGLPIAPEPVGEVPPPPARALPPQPRPMPERVPGLRERRAEPVEEALRIFGAEGEAERQVEAARAEADAQTELARDTVRRLVERRLQAPEEPPPPVTGELEPPRAPEPEPPPAEPPGGDAALELQALRLLEEIRRRRAGAPPGESRAAAPSPTPPPGPSGPPGSLFQPRASVEGGKPLEPIPPPEPRGIHGGRRVAGGLNPAKDDRLRALVAEIDRNRALAEGPDVEVAASARRFVEEFTARLRREAEGLRPEEVTAETAAEVRAALETAPGRGPGAPETAPGREPAPSPTPTAPEPPHEVGGLVYLTAGRHAGRRGFVIGKKGKRLDVELEDGARTTISEENVRWEPMDLVEGETPGEPAPPAEPTPKPALTAERATVLWAQLEAAERALASGIGPKGPLGRQAIESLIKLATEMRREMGLEPVELVLMERARSTVRTREEFADLARWAPGRPSDNPAIEEARLGIGRAQRALSKTKVGTADHRHALEEVKAAQNAFVAVQRAEGATPPTNGEGGGNLLASGLGALGEFGRKKKTPVRTALQDPRMERLFTLEPGRVPLRDRIAARLRQARKAWDEYFTWEPEFRDDPEFRNDLRVFQDAYHDAARYRVESLTKILGKLDTGEFRGEEEQLRRVVGLADMAQRARRGQAQPGGFTADEYRAELEGLLRDATPAVRDAWQAHRDVMRALAEEDVARGKLDPAVLETDDYYPHHIVDISNVLAQIVPSLPRELREPYRPWTKRAEGSERSIDFDYVSVMGKHLMRVKLAQKLDDFAINWLNRRDVLADMSPATRAQVFGVDPETGEPRGPRRHMDRYEVDGKPYLAYQYRPYGWQPYAPSTPIEAATLDALARPKEKFYLVPEKLGLRLHNFRYTPRQTLVEESLRTYVGAWKRLLIDMLGARFNWKNLGGDLVDLYREDAPALLNLLRAPTIWRAIRGTAAPDYRDFQRIIEQQRVVSGSTFFGPQVAEAQLERRLARYKSTRERLGRVLWRPLEYVEVLANYREAWPRVAKALTDYERIRAGGTVVTKAIDVEGLPPEAALGKAAREFAVDYGRVPEKFRQDIRGLLFPFATWYAQEFSNWGRYAAKHPVELATKFGIVFGALWYWNNRVQGEVEKDLEPWLREYPFHLNTGYRDEDGKNIVYAGQFGPDVAFRFVGVQKLPAALGRYARGEYGKGQEATERFLEEALSGPAWTAVQTMLRTAEATRKGPAAMARAGLATAAEGAGKWAEDIEDLAPFAQIPHGLVTGIDPFTKRRIVEARDRGTKYEWEQKAIWLAQKLLPPLSQFQIALDRAARRPESNVAKVFGRGLPGRFIEGLLQGPLDLNPIHAYEFRNDPQMGKLAGLRDAAARGTRARSEALHDIEAGVRGAATGQGIERLREALRETAERGVAVRGEDVKRRFRQSIPLLEDLARARLESAVSPEDREQARQLLRRLRLMQGLTFLRQTPKAARPFLAEEAQR